MAEHQIVKPEKIVLTAAAALEDSLVVPAVFRREGIDKFKGAKDDTVNVVVDGVLPYREYGWRADRSKGVIFDEYADRKVAVSFGGDTYSAVRLTDEQNEMDFDGWAKLASKQTEAIGRGLEVAAIDAVQNAPYEVLVTLDEANLRRSLLNLSKVMDRLRVPGQRTLLCGADLQVALLDDDKLFGKDASDAGDIGAALKEATIGRRYKFNFVKADELDGDEAVAMTEGAFIFLTAAPSVPASVPFGATASVNGVALRWIRDYDSEHFQDRSIFNCWRDFHTVADDTLISMTGAEIDGNRQAKVSSANHFVRAVKVELGDAYSVEVSNAELSEFTGVDSTDGASDGV